MYHSGKSVELAAQQRLVVGRQRTGARRELPSHERVGGIVVERARVGVVERRQVGRVAEVGQQQEAAREVLRRGRAAHAARRRAAAARRGRTAGSPPAAAARPSRSAYASPSAGASRRDAEIAAEARVRGRGRQSNARVRSAARSSRTIARAQASAASRWSRHRIGAVDAGDVHGPHGRSLASALGRLECADSSKRPCRLLPHAPPSRLVRSRSPPRSAARLACSAAAQRTRRR